MNNITKKVFEDKNIEFKVENGEVWGNANSMTDSKTLSNWKSSNKTKEYIEKIQTIANLGSLVISKSGVNGGTWIHEKLILNLARYNTINL